MKPLSEQQQKIVLSWEPIVREWVEQAVPNTFRRDDALSDAYLALCQAVKCFCGQPDGWIPYLRTAIINEIRRSNRREAKHNHAPLNGDGLPSRELPPDFQAMADEIPERDRKILDWLTDGKSVEDIISATGTSRRTVYRRITDARESFKKLFND